ncbi:hypothetical protein FPOAC2_12962 [Fusarium poae]|uniref:AAA+ ATPase domain-containing protein n=1 Tax=Fusarium poae TaxID=36050 RepID=A0A1B8AHS3_FUSPO|nr:hypothetical protein FPOA_11714 [Fusarium poae]
MTTLESNMPIASSFENTQLLAMAFVPLADRSGTSGVASRKASIATEAGIDFSELQNETSESTKHEGTEARKPSDPAVAEAGIPIEDPVKEGSVSEVVIMEQIDWKSRIRDLPLLVSVGEFDFEDFKNRWGEDSRYHVVELLMGSDTTAEEKRREESKRDEKSPGLGFRQKPKTKSSTGEQWIQRIRIHSPFVLKVLEDVMNPPDWSCEEPRVFFRPFRCLLHYHDYVKERLEDLERKYQETTGHGSGDDHLHQLQTKVAGGAENKATENGSMESTNKIGVNEVERSSGNSIKVELEHLRCYVEFMDNRVMPMEGMFDSTNRRMVAFDELWYLFKPGDVLYAPINTCFKASEGLGPAKERYHTAFKLYATSSTYIDDDDPDDVNGKNRTILLWCYYIDYNGESYGPVKKNIDIDFFGGKKEIRDLPAYPIRFASNVEKLQEDLSLQGKRFGSTTKQGHVSCEGWTITGPPLGYEHNEGDENPEHVEGDVIIDFQQALRRHPSWKPEFVAPSEDTDEHWKYGSDDMEIIHWPASFEPGKPKAPLCSIRELTQRDDNSETKIKSASISKDVFLQAYQEDDVSTLEGLDEDTNSLLLPRRVFVYVLRQRRFTMVDIYSLEPIPLQSTIFDDLRIDESHKLIVQSLVDAHFEKRKIQRHRPGLGPVGQDLVRGKGSGLFILLHGVPGVGKTATAEAVAQAHKKPLFSITCGDLGLTPEAIDSKLNEVFRLAHLWDCVLLLDEADIFLARRDTYNLQRNALVSVFLRVLEYYSGILFLTTNRVGILDEAFKSRIHISLYYEPLSRQQTVDIFRVNIKKLRGIEEEKQRRLKGTEDEQPRLQIMAKRIIEYAQHYYDEHEDTPHLRWNGRQIRNAFQIASSLAHYNMNKVSLDTANPQSGQVALPVLDERQFEKVAVAIEQFGNYMDYTKAMTDADQARIDMTRADHMRNEDLTPRKRGHNRRQEQTQYSYRSPSTYGDGPPREPMMGDVRRRVKDDMPPARPTRQRDGGLTGRPEAPARNPRARTQTGAQSGPSASARTAAVPQRHERRSNYYPDEDDEEEDEYMDKREFGVSDKRSRNKAGINDRGEEDYDDDDQPMDWEVRQDLMGDDEPDYDD